MPSRAARACSANQPASKNWLDRCLGARVELFAADIVALVTRADDATFEPLATIDFPESMVERSLSGAPEM